MLCRSNESWSQFVCSGAANYILIFASVAVGTNYIKSQAPSFPINVIYLAQCITLSVGTTFVIFTLYQFCKLVKYIFATDRAIIICGLIHNVADSIMGHGFVISVQFFSCYYVLIFLPVAMQIGFTIVIYV